MLALKLGAAQARQIADAFAGQEPPGTVGRAGVRRLVAESPPALRAALSRAVERFKTDQS